MINDLFYFLARLAKRHNEANTKFLMKAKSEFKIKNLKNAQSVICVVDLNQKQSIKPRIVRIKTNK